MLRDRVIYDMVKNASPSYQIRVWVTGCSTGEEAYSIAILFAEVMEELGVRRDVKIFATDRSGLLNDLTKVFSEKDISIMRISSMTSKQGIATLMFGFEVKSREELHEIIARLQSVRDVRAIKRSNG